MSRRKYPQIYCNFIGKKVVNGKGRNYWIQDATEDMFPAILEHLSERFIGDEPTTKYLKCKDDPESMKDFKEMWIKLLDEKLSLVCLTKDEQNNVKLAGFNVLTQCVAGQKYDYKVTGDTITRLFKIFDYAENQRDFLQEFNLTKCMKAMGLYVLLDYRGDGLGERLLDARELLCRAVGVNATITAFSSGISQRCASKVGFKDFYEETYENLGNIDADMKIHGIEEHSKSIRFMYKLYQ